MQIEKDGYTVSVIESKELKAAADKVEAASNLLCVELVKIGCLAKEILDEYFTRGIGIEDKGSYWQLAFDYKHFASLQEILCDIITHTEPLRGDLEASVDRLGLLVR